MRRAREGEAPSLQWHRPLSAPSPGGEGGNGLGYQVQLAELAYSGKEAVEFSGQQEILDEATDIAQANDDDVARVRQFFAQQEIRDVCADLPGDLAIDDQAWTGARALAETSSAAEQKSAFDQPRHRLVAKLVATRRRGKEPVRNVTRLRFAGDVRQHGIEQDVVGWRRIDEREAVEIGVDPGFEREIHEDAAGEGQVQRVCIARRELSAFLVEQEQQYLFGKAQHGGSASRCIAGGLYCARGGNPRPHPSAIAADVNVNPPPQPPPGDAGVETGRGDRSRTAPSQAPVAAIFVLSGFAALVYQVAWQRALFTIYGVDIESATVVVTAFMLGLGLGSLAGGRIADRPGFDHLGCFAVIEALVCAYGVASLALFAAVGDLTGPAGAGGVFVATFALVLVPTALMGATLPLLAAHAARSSGNVGHSLAVFYFANTIGGAVAAIVTAIFLLRYMGLQSSVLVAAGLNAAVALAAGALRQAHRRRA